MTLRRATDADDVRVEVQTSGHGADPNTQGAVSGSTREPDLLEVVERERKRIGAEGEREGEVARRRRRRSRARNGRHSSSRGWARDAHARRTRRSRGGGGDRRSAGGGERDPRGIGARYYDDK